MTKRIFLTGASSGIGRATAELLASLGHEIWGTSRDPQRVPKASGIHPIRLDLSEPHSIEECFQSAVDESGGFDVVINNAGSGHFGPAELITRELMTAQFQLLVFAQVALCRLALASMRSRGGGLIINITSLASRMPVPYMAAYNAAKAAMASFTMSLQLELEGSGIRVVDVQPGDICTDFNDAVVKAQSVAAHDTVRLEKVWRAVDRNMKTAPKPELVARRIAHLIEASNPPPRSTVGDVFQSRIAPLIFRFLPQRVRVWGLKRYYRL